MTLRRQVILTVFVFLVTLLNFFGCAREGSSDTAQSTDTPVPAPATVTANDLKKLRWIEGTWRGSGYETPFYERYRFEDDNTLTVENLADESVSKVTETTRYELKEGKFGNGRSVATEVTDSYITFSPVARAGNSYRWQKESADSWKAILTSAATAKAPAKEVVYRLERWPPAKK